MKKILSRLLNSFISRETAKPYTTDRSRAIDCVTALLEYLEGPEC